MPKISSLSTSTTLQSTDILVGTDVSDSNKSKNFTLGDLASFVNTTPNGTGTPAFVPRFSSSTTVEDSIIYASPTKVGIGNSSPDVELHVDGDIYLDAPAEVTSNNKIFTKIGSGESRGILLGNTEGGIVEIGGNSSGSFILGRLNDLTLKTIRNADYFRVKVGLSETELITVNPNNNNTGINKTNPGHTLDVGGNIHTNSELRITGTSDTAAISYNDTNGLSITPPDTKPVLIGSTGSPTNTNKLIVEGNVQSEGFILSSLNTAPASASATGTAGDIRFTADHIYLCVAANTWKRVAIATF